MLSIQARNVNEALQICLEELQVLGTLRPSRNGQVLAFPYPVATTYFRPDERVLFSPTRNANPTFHLVESLWMLHGRNDVEFPATFVKNMKAFSDDGKTFWGAYGRRWRSFFGWDQIDGAIKELTNNPESRRVVIVMWNATNDDRVIGDFQQGVHGCKDVPCNTHIYLDRRDGKLNMTVCCRSNDILWGCYGANAVHMSILQEYIARSIGCDIGTYTQFSNDLHLYVDKAPKEGLQALAQSAGDYNLYAGKSVVPTKLWNLDESREAFDEDTHAFFDAFDRNGIPMISATQFNTDFYNFTVRPMVTAWGYRHDWERARDVVDNMDYSDWRRSMIIWLNSNFKKDHPMARSK